VIKLSAVVKEFTTFADLIKSIDEELNTLKQQLADYLRRLEDIRAKSEQERKLKELLKNLTGEEQSSKGRVVDLKEVKLFINPDAEQEASVLEEIIDRINKTIQSLQSIRKSLEPLSGVEVEAKIVVVYKEGVPSSIILKLSS
jgi:GTP1/Obg family GTP-binding protein